MASAAFTPVVRYIHRIAAAQAGHLTDSALLDRFAEGHDEEAFAILVHRHGRLVLGACRRIVRDWHAAEDCFQAVFLVLASKAQTLRRTDSLGPWLHTVAHRVSYKARSRAATRLRHERNAFTRDAFEPGDDLIWRDLHPFLDDAIASLQKKYRIPFILCYLQGRTVSDIARELGQPHGTVAARLARAREQLRRRLVRRGITLSGPCLALALSDGAANAAVPPALVTGTIKAAGLVAAGRAVVAASTSTQTAALMEGAMRSMFITKMRMVGGALAAVAVGAALLGYQAMAADQAQEKPMVSATRAASKSIPGVLPAPKFVWHEARFLIYDVDQEGVETVIARPIMRIGDKVTGTCNIGEEIMVGNTKLFQGLRCAVTLTALDNGKVSIDCSASRNDKIFIMKNGAKATITVSQTVGTFNVGEQVELELYNGKDSETKTLVRIDTSTYTDKQMEEVEIVPTPLPDRPIKPGKK
jgi:RNA polymerase sigma factor (sigma-70 family)